MTQNQRNYHKRQIGNLPGGEISQRLNTNGVFSLMASFAIISANARRPESSPLTVEVENNRVRSLKSETRSCATNLRFYKHDENSNRVGQFAIGTNTACRHVIGHILQDEKIPGSTSLSSSLRQHAGANSVSKTHIDCVGRTSTFGSMASRWWRRRIFSSDFAVIASSRLPFFFD